MFGKYLDVSWEPNSSMPENLAKVCLYWGQKLAWQVVIVSMLEIASAAATVEGKAANIVQHPQTLKPGKNFASGRVVDIIYSNNILIS